MLLSRVIFQSFIPWLCTDFFVSKSAFFFIIENGNNFLLKLDQDINSIVNLKKSEEEDFLKYECFEKVRMATDSERIHQKQITEKFENVLKEQLKDRLEKYETFFRRGTLLLKEFLIIKYDIQIQKLQKNTIKNEREPQTSLLTNFAIDLEPHENNQTDKTKELNIKYPVVTTSTSNHNCINVNSSDQGNLNEIPFLNNNGNTFTGSCLVSLPEYFYFKKLTVDSEELDKIYVNL